MWLVSEMSPLLSAMRNGCFALLPVSIEVVVMVGGGIGWQGDIQPSPKLCELQERSAGTDGRSCPELVRKRFPNQFRFRLLLLSGSNCESPPQFLY